MKFSDSIVQEDMQELLVRQLPYDNLKDSKILITGASGMLATYLTYFFMFLNKEKSYNIKVFALVRNAEKAWERFDEFRNDNNFQLVVQDICAPLEIEDNIDYIIHAAGNASPYFIMNDPVGIIKANTIGTMNVLEYAKKAKTKKVLYTSTREVYGKMPGNTKEITEGTFGSMDPTELRACYPESKRMSETLLQSYAHQYKVPYNTVRIAHSYGPGMVLNNDGRVMADFISDIVHGRDIVLKSTGEAKRAFCYITDAVSGMLYVLLKGKEGEAYNIANETEEKAIKDVAQLLTDLFPESKSKVIIDIPSEASAGYSKMGRVKLSTSKLEKLGWSCGTDLAKGLEKTVNSSK